MTCYVCDSPVPVIEEHHVVMRSRGGIDGPTVDLCANCHSAVHMSARAMVAGKSPDKYLEYYDHEQRGRALVLIKAIVVVELAKEDKRNPHPLLNVTLDHPIYLTALALLQKDRGFTSRDRLVNALCREIAIQYGLLVEPSQEEPGSLVSLASVRNKQRTNALR